jgi:hypothetical protein
VFPVCHGCLLIFFGLELYYYGQKVFDSRRPAK